MAKKIKDIVAKTGEYEDRNTGKTKARWETVGALMEDKDGHPFVMLKRTFNPAGLPNPDNRDSCLLSCFDPDRDKGSRNSGSDNSSNGSSSGGSRSDMDDDIPF